MADNSNKRSAEAKNIGENDKLVLWQNGAARYVTAGKLAEYFDSKVYEEYLSLFLQRANQTLTDVKSSADEAASAASSAVETANAAAKKADDAATQAADAVKKAGEAPKSSGTAAPSAANDPKAFRFRGYVKEGALSEHRSHGWYYISEKVVDKVTDFPEKPSNISYLQNFRAEKSVMQVLYIIFGRTWVRYIMASGSVGEWHPYDHKIKPHKKRQTAFVDAVNRKAKAIGMGGTVLTSPTAMGRTNHTCASDLLKCVVYAHTYGTINRAWGMRETLIFPKGREVPLKSGIDYSVLKGYQVLGGLAGEYEHPVYSGSFVCVARHLATGLVLAGVVLDSPTPEGRFQAMKELLDATMETLRTGKTSVEVASADCAASCLVSENSVAVNPIVKKNEMKVTTPSSAGKLLTMIVASDCVQSIREKYTVTAEDLDETEEEILRSGDVVTLEDLMLYAVLGPSDAACVALASHFGGDL